MVTEKLEQEVEKIIECIEQEKNFLLSGGAGSGKTYSLVQLLRKLLENKKLNIACITYTNAAVKEINERLYHSNLKVLTIHDFLWDNIKNYQKELKKAVIELNNNPDNKFGNSEKILEADYFKAVEKIKYKEYLKIQDGIISHDEVIELANYMFKNYTLLCDIVKDKFQFIFIDEYQDTDAQVIEIFLTHLKKSTKKNIIGFFGDSMQSIYEDGVGEIESYINSGDVTEIQKKQNRRNPKKVIEFANQLRRDGLKQEESSDLKAPNMLDGKIKEGTIKFLYSNKDYNLDEIRKTAHFNGWDFSDSKNTKELNLTHKLIANKANFINIYQIYDSDPILGLKNDINKKIKDGKIVIDENLTFDAVANQVNISARGSSSKKEKILQEPKNTELYNQLKDKPFFEVKKLYLDKDLLLDDKKDNEMDEEKDGKVRSQRDDLIKHLFKIQEMINLYDKKKYNDFIRKTEFKITSLEDKQKIKNIISKFGDMKYEKLEKIIEHANETGICQKDDRLNDFIEKKKYIYDRVTKEITYGEFINLYEYLEGQTILATQHKIKGNEFKNVFIILDNGKWNRYNYKAMFLNDGNENVLRNTQNLFYVCCTRAKENLIMFYSNPEVSVIAKAKEWFGEGNVYEVD